MNGVLQAFVTAAAVAVLSAIAIMILKRFVPENPTPTESKETIPYSQANRIRFASISVIIAWVSLLTFVLAIGASALHILNPVVIAWAVLSLVVFFSFYVIAAIFLKCDKCRRRMLFQWSNQIIPPFSEKIFGMTGWAGIVLKVVIRKKFRCMYCGQKYDLHKS